jgi:hypothetical protein
MYKAILFAPNGEWVIDYRGHKTILEVIDEIADQGSRWFFYPIAFVIVDKGIVTNDRQRIVSASDEFLHLQGRTIRSVVKDLQTNDYSYLD